MKSFTHPTHRLSIVPEAAVAQFLAPGTEVQVPYVGGRSPRSRPVAAVRAHAANERI